MTKCTAYYSSPIGVLEIQGSEEGIYSISFLDKAPSSGSPVPACLEECVSQLDEYFHKKRKKFTLKLMPEGSEFQKMVWNELMKIPFGKTYSYKDIAMKIKDEKFARAIGYANGKNRIPIIIPCHRIIANNGKMGGYSGGLSKKEWLLAHEGIRF